jgi:antitoxin MazE
MQIRVRRWGNSLALRIPKALAHEAHLEEDGLVELAVVDGKLTVEPIIDEEVLTLEQLMAGVTDENLHGEWNTGPAVGNEEW